ncbi:MAG: hypothetical protein K0B81_08100 [Candidatus Cloacimonetes bacterium]|nr:hypothetical protein [Candidatus Cloacimonadota bacterium]
MKKMYYWRLPESLIRLMNLTVSMHGKCGKYIFQNSHGGRQVKLYKPEVYKNNINTPLRKRTRDIWKLAYENPVPTLHEKIRELFRHYPYYLLKTKPINLKLKNFYFEKELNPSSLIRIFKVIGEFPAPENDLLYIELCFNQNKKVEFHYSEEESERFYAQNIKTGELSNVLYFHWG